MGKQESGSKEPRGFRKAFDKANEVIKQEGKISKLLKEAEAKAVEQKTRLSAVWEDLNTFIRVIKAWSGGAYQKVPWKTILYLLAALLYFVNPFDLIFDFIPIVGFIDDISVIGFVLASVHTDLELFRQWEIDNSTPVE